MARAAKYQTVTVEVTQRDINTGKRSQGATCPIAKAFKRLKLYKRSVAIGVGGESIRVGEGFYGKLPALARSFVIKFDSMGKKAVKPFSFRVRVPITA